MNSKNFKRILSSLAASLTVFSTLSASISTKVYAGNDNMLVFGHLSDCGDTHIIALLFPDDLVNRFKKEQEGLYERFTENLKSRFTIAPSNNPIGKNNAQIYIENNKDGERFAENFKSYISMSTSSCNRVEEKDLLTYSFKNNEEGIKFMKDFSSEGNKTGLSYKTLPCIKSIADALVEEKTTKELPKRSEKFQRIVEKQGKICEEMEELKKLEEGDEKSKKSKEINKMIEELDRMMKEYKSNPIDAESTTTPPVENPDSNSESEQTEEQPAEVKQPEIDSAEQTTTDQEVTVKSSQTEEKKPAISNDAPEENETETKDQKAADDTSEENKTEEESTTNDTPEENKTEEESTTNDTPEENKTEEKESATDDTLEENETKEETEEKKPAISNDTSEDRKSKTEEPTERESVEKTKKVETKGLLGRIWDKIKKFLSHLPLIGRLFKQK